MCLIKDVFWWVWKQKQDKGKWATLYYKRNAYSQSHPIICIDHDGDRGGASQLLSWQKQYTKQISFHEGGSEFLLQWVMKAFSHKTNHILFIPSNELGLSSSRERYSEHLQPSVKPSGHTWFWAAFKSVLGPCQNWYHQSLIHNTISSGSLIGKGFFFVQHDNDPKHPSIVVKAYLDGGGGETKQDKKNPTHHFTTGHHQSWIGALKVWIFFKKPGKTIP